MNTRTYDSNRPQEVSCGLTCKKENPLRWGERRYYALDYYLKQNFGEKLYKISLNGGCSCPNRDGTCGTRGCIFCSEGGSGDFAASSSLSVADQLAYGKDLVRPKYNGHSYIAYFQAYTNTYAPACHLRRIFTEAISDPEVRILSIATRPDCLSPEILTLLAELNAIKPVWVELGLQTIHERTANWMRRGYPLSVFEQAVHSLHAIGVQIITHVILFLPGESEADMLATIHYLNALPIDGIKLQLLHVLKHTDLADFYRQEPFYIPDMNSYFHLLGKCIASLRPDIVIHRLTGDGPKSLLIAPLWTGNKRLVLNQMQRYLKEQNLWQGKEYTTF